MYNDPMYDESPRSIGEIALDLADVLERRHAEPDLRDEIRVLLAELRYARTAERSRQQALAAEASRERAHWRRIGELVGEDLLGETPTLRP
jgi:hypothetical protein